MPANRPQHVGLKKRYTLRLIPGLTYMDGAPIKASAKVPSNDADVLSLILFYLQNQFSLPATLSEQSRPESAKPIKVSLACLSNT